jgi:nicotinamide-nucleotide amidase
MAAPTLPEPLYDAALAVADRLRASGSTVAIAESAGGGLLSAALLAVPGASAYYLGGLVVYTAAARTFLTGALDAPAGLRGATEPFARYEADAVRAALGATWGVGETGAAGPAGNAYGDPAGHAWVAVSGPASATQQVLTGSDDRQANMAAFAGAALGLLAWALDEQGSGDE